MGDDKIIVTVDSDLEELIPGFLENRTKELRSLREAVGEKDFDSLQHIGHTMKGLGGGYGFNQMSTLGAEIESSAQGKDFENLAVLVDSYEDYLKRIEIVFK